MPKWHCLRWLPGLSIGIYGYPVLKHGPKKVLRPVWTRHQLSRLSGCSTVCWSWEKHSEGPDFIDLGHLPNFQAGLYVIDCHEVIGWKTALGTWVTANSQKLWLHHICYDSNFHLILRWDIHPLQYAFLWVKMKEVVAVKEESWRFLIFHLCAVR